MNSNDFPFHPAELTRYSRQLILPGFGLAAQERLRSSKVLVVGAGGLGSPLLLYLASAGVGKIGIVEPDLVESSNLQRQVLYDERQVGQLKVEAAKARLQALNPHIQVESYPWALTRDNALELISPYDLVADGTDNFPTRYLVNDACVLLDKVNVYASIYQFEGQVSVFHGLLANGERGPNYRDLYPTPPPPEQVPSCAEGGVLGVLPGIIGSMQALEVIKVLTGLGEPLVGKLFLFDALNFFSRTLALPKDSANPLRGTPPRQQGLVDYAAFCGHHPAPAVPEIQPRELAAWQKEGRPFTLVDIREPYERQLASLGGLHQPLAQLDAVAADWPADRPAVLYCRTGKRSARAVQHLQRQEGLPPLLSLSGGLLGWIETVEPGMRRY